MTDRKTTDHTRRALMKSLALIPLVAGPQTTAEAAEETYRPSFFNDREWTFLNAACDRLIPADATGPGAIESGVPQFIDRHMQTPYAAGDIWYRQGPFIEASPDFGYQGRLTLRDILRVGFKAVDEHCAKTFAGKSFADLSDADKEKVLSSCHSGELKLEGISSKTFFTHLLAETRDGYFSDPQYGGNKGMGAWKMIGYPGPRGDYLDWVEVRDRPYPLPPVAISGRRA